MESIKELKSKIRALKKLKRQTQVGSQTRRDINRQIRELKKQGNIAGQVDQEKAILIDKINKVYKHYADLTKFTTEQLQKHLDLILKEKAEGRK